MRCSHPRKEQRMRARYSSMLAAAVAVAASTGALFESVEPPRPAAPPVAAAFPNFRGPRAPARRRCQAC